MAQRQSWQMRSLHVNVGLASFTKAQENMKINASRALPAVFLHPLGQHRQAKCAGKVSVHAAPRPRLLVRGLKRRQRCRTGT